MSDEPIYLTRDGAIAEMVLNRPDKHNALNRHIWNAIPALCGEVAEDPETKVLIVRGVGGEAFAAGADISEFPEVHATPESARAYHGEIRQAYNALAGLNKPTIAMINGICFGGGCAIAVCCDMRYASTDARFCIPPAKLGLTYTLFETKRLCDLVGPAKTKEMLMGAKVIEAEEAFTVGLATRLFAPADLEAGTRAFASELAGLSQFTIRGVKTIVGEILAGAHDETENSRTLSAQAFDGPDYTEGRDAFLEKRRPKFTYR
jgi:enoyl-CoA hydratase/carnithine racemase